jgi:hypothetical protein
VRGGKPHVASALGRDWGVWSRFGLRLIFAAIAALAIGFAVGLRAVPAGISVSETIRSKDFAPWASLGSQVPGGRRYRVASLDTATAFELGSATPTRRGAFSAEDFAVGSRVVSFDERFARLFGTAQTEADGIVPPSSNPGGHAARRSGGQSALGLMPLPPIRPANASKKQVRIADASEDSSSPPDADSHTAIYDISAHRVYLPDGRTLEAHSGLGSRLDDPRYVSDKHRGPTPPNVYDLSMREELFHGVRAIRLNPVGGGNMFGREGMLAHSYMLGPNGESNGCVSFSAYPAFLNAFLSGEINRLVVVEHLATAPSPKTAFGWLPATIRSLFGRS